MVDKCLNTLYTVSRQQDSSSGNIAATLPRAERRGRDICRGKPRKKRDYPGHRGPGHAAAKARRGKGEKLHPAQAEVRQAPASWAMMV